MPSGGEYVNLRKPEKKRFGVGGHKDSNAQLRVTKNVSLQVMSVVRRQASTWVHLGS